MDRPNRIPLPGESNQLVDRLVGIVERLYRETPDFVDRPEDAQAWYNRGYANGVIGALERAGRRQALSGRVDCDPDDVAEPYQVFAWGQAYAHGFQKGFDEAHEVLLTAGVGSSTGSAGH